MARRIKVTARLDSNIAEQAKKDGKSVERLTKELEELGDKGTKSFEALGQATVAFGAGVTLVGLKVGKDLADLAFETTKQAQKVQTQFKTILGSAEAAQERYAELAQFAASTPFTLNGVAESSKILETLTEGALSTGAGLRLVGDAAAISGENFSNLSVQVGRAYSGLQANRPIGEALARLQELGLVTGTTRNEIERLQKAARGQEAWEILEEALKNTEGGMEELAKTFEGKTSTIVDNAGLIGAKFLETSGIQDTWNDILDETIERLGKLAKEQNTESLVQQAKATSVLNRTYEQQVALIADLEEQQKRLELRQQARSVDLKEEEAILSASIKRQKELLPLIEARIKREKDAAAALTAKKKADDEAAKTARIQEVVTKKLGQEQDKNLERLRKETEARKKANDQLLETLRLQDVEAANRQEQNALEQAEFERKVQEDIAILTADRYEKQQILIQQEIDAYALRASEIYDTEKELNDSLIQLNEIYAARVQKLDNEITQEKIKNTLQVASVAVDSLQEIFGENKAFAVADILINTARGIQRSFADLGPPFNFIQAGLIGASGAAQLSKVNSAKFADGTEFFSASGTSRSDSGNARLSDGERVVDANNNARLNGITNDQLAELANGGGSRTIVITDLFTREEVAQRIKSYAAFADERDLPVLI